MRVGRISPIKFVTYKEAKAIFRYFSLKGVVRVSGQELSDVNTLQPYQKGNIKQEAFAQKSLNRLVLDSFEKKELAKLTSNDKIDLVRDMIKARNGSKVNVLDYMLKSDSAKFDVISSKEKQTEREAFKTEDDRIKYSDVLKEIETKKKKKEEEEKEREDKVEVKE